MKWQLEEVTSGKTKVLMIAQGKKVEGRKGSQKAWDTDLEVRGRDHACRVARSRSQLKSQPQLLFGSATSAAIPITRQ